MEFKSITTVEDLISYLNDSPDRLNGRKYIYHYTTIDRCIDIYNSKLWFLSKANCMNDQLEFNNGDPEIWNNVFFASFMSDAKESIGMWSMYSQPWEEGVQIAIPVKEARNWIKKVTYIKEISCVDFKPTGREIRCDENNRVFLSSVAYSSCDNPIDGQNKLIWSNVQNTNFPKAPHIKELTGYIKDSAWEYEKEIRIKAYFDNALGFSKAAIDIEESVLDSIMITASPLFEGNLKERLENNIQRHFTPHESLFSGRLLITSPCANCSLKGERTKGQR